MVRNRSARNYFRPVAVAALCVLATGAAALTGIGGTASAAGSGGCGKTPTMRSGSYSAQINGQNRTYIIRVPDGYDSSRQYKLILAYHWNGGTMNDVSSGGTDGALWSYYGQQKMSNNTAILVAPQGLNNGWANSGGQDVSFTDAMVSRIEGDLCVDTGQVFATGFSYGGGMSYALACARATTFRAVAVFSGGQLSGCSGGTQPVAYLGLHGVSDPVLNISQGRTLRDTFVRANGCTAQSPPEPRAGSGTHIVTTYSGCRAGYPVVWAPFDGGHQPAPVEGCSGCDSGAKTWTPTLVWSFFSQFQGTTTTTTTTTTTSRTTTTTTTTTTPIGTTTTTTTPIDTTTTTTPIDTTTTTTGGGGGGCTATAGPPDQWPGGFVQSVTVTAGASSISGWRVTINLPAGATRTSGWNATFSGSTGTMEATNLNYNGSIAAGQSTTFGFQGTGTAAGITVSCTRL